MIDTKEEMVLLLFINIHESRESRVTATNPDFTLLHFKVLLIPSVNYKQTNKQKGIKTSQALNTKKSIHYK